MVRIDKIILDQLVILKPGDENSCVTVDDHLWQNACGSQEQRVDLKSLYEFEKISKWNDENKLLKIRKIF